MTDVFDTNKTSEPFMNYCNKVAEQIKNTASEFKLQSISSLKTFSVNGFNHSLKPNEQLRLVKQVNDLKQIAEQISLAQDSVSAKIEAN